MNIRYNYDRVIDGLSALSSESHIQIQINKGAGDLDDIFDFEPLDWLESLMRKNEVSDVLYQDIHKLYLDIDGYTAGFSVEEEDKLIANNTSPMSDWRIEARRLKEALELEFQNKLST